MFSAGITEELRLEDIVKSIAVSAKLNLEDFLVNGAVRLGDLIDTLYMDDYISRDLYIDLTRKLIRG
jgi:hypothetical protein